MPGAGRKRLCGVVRSIFGAGTARGRDQNFPLVGSQLYSPKLGLADKQLVCWSEVCPRCAGEEQPSCLKEVTERVGGDPKVGNWRE